MGVAPVVVESSCCIAVSYEAKPFGVKTGTRISEARRLCPGIRIVPAQVQQYIRFHHMALAAVDKVLPVHRVYSIDEFECRLLGPQRDRNRAVELALEVKAELRTALGDFVPCSIGIAPNRLLAKIAGEQRKPDGLTVVEQHEVSGLVDRLELTDIPGIAGKMSQRLRWAGVQSPREFVALREADAARAWGSVVGVSFWHWLRGGDVPEQPVHKRSIGHQHVLPPEFRQASEAYGVAVRLLTKASVRLRRERMLARRLRLDIRFERKGYWSADHVMPECDDDLTLIGRLAILWGECPPGRLLRISVTLCDLCPPQSATGILFPESRRRKDLSQSIDAINAVLGATAVYPAAMHRARTTAPMRIPFGGVPTQ